MTPDMTTLRYDLVIIGGGIAGLWTLAQARTQGFNAILFEKGQLGQGQTVSSQGIIHGGSKYALAGSISRATSMISDMPDTWRNAISGHGSFSLPGIETLSDTQHLVPSSGIDTQLLSFLGSKSMSSHTEKIPKDRLPAGYRELGIRRSIFRLNEIVLDIQTLLQAFRQQFGSWIYQHEVADQDITASDDAAFRHSIRLPGANIHCAYVVLAGGEGNDRFTGKSTAMQTRPLHMVMMKGKNLPRIYAHFIGRSTKPVLTITSHPTPDGKVVWYMGGDLAENGIDTPETAQIDEARKLLARLMPGLALDNGLAFGTHRVSRAEPRQHTLTRPDDAFTSIDNNIITGWPTKLALAPRFAEKVLAEITPRKHASPAGMPDLPLPRPAVAGFPWHSL